MAVVMEKKQQRRSAGLLVGAVLMLSVPSVAFVLSHIILERLMAWLPQWLALVLAWTLFLAGMLGPLSTGAAVVLTLVASFLRGVPTTAKALCWTFAIVSLLAVAYLAQTPP